ncbi:MAG: DNA repair protein RecO [Deltaproteobacteria bacterium]|nr:DNA repair protein RecO [Deltaproteobacteria bacterium]
MTTTRGIVLRTTPVRESDLVVTLYTEEHGRIGALARGGRRSQRRFAGALSVLVLAQWRLGRPPRGDLWSLEAADVEREWTQLGTDVVGVAHASYALELVGALLPAEVPEPSVLELVVALWDVLAASGPSPAALRGVELALLELAGHRPALDACAACHAPVAGGAVFDASRGGAICRACAPASRGPGVRQFEEGAGAYLCAIAEVAELGVVVGLDRDPRFSPADRHAARDAMVAMVTSLAERPLRSLEYIAKLGAAVARRDA